MSTPSVRVEFGHVLDVLQGMPEQSVQMIATSPPYFGLRDYGLEPVVWDPVVYTPMPGLPDVCIPPYADPQRFPTCTHEWDDWQESHDIRETPIHGKTRTTDRSYGEDSSRRFDGNHQKHAHGQYCRHCGAWRGCLGLESDPSLYVGHMVQVFRELRRVLSDDGVAWLNLGDSYAGNRSYQVRQTKGGPKHGIAQAAGGRGQKASDYNLKPKDLIGIPWRVAFALQADGWYLRSDVVWAKGASMAKGWHGNPMPESVKDRPTRAHEMVFLLSKKERYFFDHEAIREKAAQSAADGSSTFGRKSGNKREQGRWFLNQEHGVHRAGRPRMDYNGPLRNMRDVWAVNTQPYRGAHFAVWPESLVRPMVLAGTSAIGHCPTCGKRSLLHASKPCSCGESLVPDVVLDPFGGSGTTAAVALSLGRHAILIEANPAHGVLQQERILSAKAAVESAKKPRHFAPSRAPHVQLDMFEDAYV